MEAKNTGTQCGGLTTGWLVSASLLAILSLIMCGAKVAQKAAAIPMRTSVRELEGSFFVCTSALSGCGLGLKPFIFIPAKGYPRSMCARKHRIGRQQHAARQVQGQGSKGRAQRGLGSGQRTGMRRGRASGSWTRVGRATAAAHFGEQPPAASSREKNGYGQAATDTQRSGEFGRKARNPTWQQITSRTSATVRPRPRPGPGAQVRLKRQLYLD